MLHTHVSVAPAQIFFPFQGDIKLWIQYIEFCKHMVSYVHCMCFCKMIIIIIIIIICLHPLRVIEKTNVPVNAHSWPLDCSLKPVVLS